MKILFRYKWLDEEKTILHYIAEGEWNWRDYHAGWRPMLFSILSHAGNVHVLLDFREQTRAAMPAGIAAHLSSFGKSHSPKLSGKGIAIGIPAADRPKLPLNEDGTMDCKTGTLYFAETIEEALQLFANF